MGANQWPMAEQGFNPFHLFKGHPEFDSDLGNNGQIGHFAPAPVIIRAPKFYGAFTISGTTRDSAGSALAGCAISLFQRDAFNTPVAQTTSDGSGAFRFTVAQNSSTFYLVAYKAGSPDVAGVTVNTLTAA
jgi:hypothetical protein